MPYRSTEPFEQLQIAGKAYATLSVAVPARLQSHCLRIAVKDLFRVHGLKTSLCNSSYYQLSSPASESAGAVQKLVDRGHHVLGLTKLSSMIAREEPSDAVDFQTAFNHEEMDTSHQPAAAAEVRRPSRLMGGLIVHLAPTRLAAAGGLHWSMGFSNFALRMMRRPWMGWSQHSHSLIHLVYLQGTSRSWKKFYPHGCQEQNRSWNSRSRALRLSTHLTTCQHAYMNKWQYSTHSLTTWQHTSTRKSEGSRYASVGKKHHQSMPLPTSKNFSRTS